MSRKLRVALIGAAGRMGKTIADLAARDPAIEIVARCDVGDAIAPAMKNSDVTIDFSHANAGGEVCAAAAHTGRPLVIGTTGHSPEQRAQIEATAKEVAIVFASNFSVGVNALFWLTRKAAELLGEDFAPEIIETHHVHKKDAPSGTAKTLAEIVKAARKSENEIPTKAIREGEVIGEHTVAFVESGERLAITHRAGNREIFAKGALRAARWVVKQKPGLYSMQDVLGL